MTEIALVIASIPAAFLISLFGTLAFLSIVS